MNWRAIQSEHKTTAGRAEALCRAVAPRDLDGVPLYLMASDDAPAGLQCEGCNAYTSPTLDLMLRHHLAANDRWQGRGIAIVVSGSVQRVGSEEIALVQTILHELAHNLDGSRRQGTVDTLPIDEIPAAAAWLIEPPAVASSVGDRKLSEPWEGHGAAWIRAAIHLGYRATQIGFWCSAADLRAGSSFYGLRGSAHYARALGDEPRNMIDASLAEIATTRMPAAFAALWERDTKTGCKGV